MGQAVEQISFRVTGAQVRVASVSQETEQDSKPLGKSFKLVA
jgi:hypothetical protein